MHHAVDIAGQADEQAELGLVLDLALDDRADRMRLLEFLPRVAQRLLEAERDAALDRVDLEHHHLHFLRGRDDLAGMHVLLGPGHFGDVDQPLDSRLQFDEGAIVGDVGDAPFQLHADRIFRLDALPRIALQLLDAERDALRLVVDADDLDLDGLADRHDLGGVIDAPPSHVGDVQEAVDTAEIDEGAIFGDVLDDALDDLALLEIGDDLRAALGTRLLEHRAARDDDIAAPPIHLQDLEGLRLVHQRADIAHRADIDLAPRQEGHGAVEIDGVAALHRGEDDALHLLIGLESLLELAPALLAACLLARDHRFAERVLDAVEINLDLVADLEPPILAGGQEFLQRHAAFGLEADIDDGHILLDRDDYPFDDAPLDRVRPLEGFLEQCRKVFAPRTRGQKQLTYCLPKSPLRAWRRRVRVIGLRSTDIRRSGPRARHRRNHRSRSGPARSRRAGAWFKSGKSAQANASSTASMPIGPQRFRPLRPVERNLHSNGRALRAILDQ